MRSLKECSNFTSWWWMPLPSISPLFSCYYSAVVFCAEMSTCNSSPCNFSKKNFQSNFHPFSPRWLFIKQHKVLYQNLVRSVPVLCSYFWSSNSQQQQQRFRFSKHEESKNRRLFWCFLWGRKNQNQRTVSQLRLFQKHQRTNSFHERTGTEPVTRRANFFIFLKFNFFFKNQSF